MSPTVYVCNKSMNDMLNYRLVYRVSNILTTAVLEMKCAEIYMSGYLAI